MESFSIATNYKSLEANLSGYSDCSNRFCHVWCICFAIQILHDSVRNRSVKAYLSERYHLRYNVWLCMPIAHIPKKTGFPVGTQREWNWHKQHEYLNGQHEGSHWVNWGLRWVDRGSCWVCEGFWIPICWHGQREPLVLGGRTQRKYPKRVVFHCSGMHAYLSVTPWGSGVGAPDGRLGDK